MAFTADDFRWTLYFSAHPSPIFAGFMNRSIFNGDRLPGVGDVFYPLLAMTLLLYIPAWFGRGGPETKWARRLASWRPVCGFILASAFSCSLMFTHTVKQIMGRARPDAVFAGKAPFTAWFCNGPLFFTHGSFTGSFPSGHTATAAISIIFAYALLACLPVRKRWWGWCCLVLALLLTILMGLARMMSASHWLTDVIFTLFSQWALVHIIFHWILQVPRHRDHFLRAGALLPQPRFFELRLCVLVIPICVGIWAFCTGLRSFGFDGWTRLLALTPAGLLLAIVFLFQAVRLATRACRFPHPGQTVSSSTYEV